MAQTIVATAEHIRKAAALGLDLQPASVGSWLYDNFESKTWKHREAVDGPHSGLYRLRDMVLSSHASDGVVLPDGPVIFETEWFDMNLLGTPESAEVALYAAAHWYLRNTFPGRDRLVLASEIVAWAGETFPDATLPGVLAHMAEEVAELDEAVRTGKPVDTIAEEAADVMHLLFQIDDRVRTIAREHDFDLLNAIREKFERNQRRTWSGMNEQGYMRHTGEANDG